MHEIKCFSEPYSISSNDITVTLPGGGLLDLRQQAEAVPQKALLPAAHLVELWATPVSTDVPAHICIAGAFIEGAVSLSTRELARSLSFVQCQFAAGIDLDDAQGERSASFTAQRHDSSALACTSSAPWPCPPPVLVI